jgi:hypothetical protein
LNHDIVAIVVAFGSILFFHTLISLQESMGVETTSNQSHLQNQIIKEQEQKNNFENQSKNFNKILGIVKNETFFPLDTKNPMILTSVMMQEARNPEAGIIDLRQYEGQIVLISYQQADEEIVWGADIVDIAGPILTIMVKKSFGLE